MPGDVDRFARLGAIDEFAQVRLGICNFDDGNDSLLPTGPPSKVARQIRRTTPALPQLRPCQAGSGRTGSASATSFGRTTVGTRLRF